MHQSVLDFGQRVLTAADVAGKRVLEVGSLNVNGSLRMHVEALGPGFYVGIDLFNGPGVDMAADICDSHWELARIDLLISTEMLEHARDWRAAVRNMKRLLAPGGVILLTTRSIGFARHHEHPGDFWRFSVEQMAAIFADFEILALEPDPGGSGGGPGVFLKALKALNPVPEVDLDAITVHSMGE